MNCVFHLKWSEVLKGMEELKKKLEESYGKISIEQKEDGSFILILKEMKELSLITLNHKQISIHSNSSSSRIAFFNHILNTFQAIPHS